MRRNDFRKCCLLLAAVCLLPASAKNQYKRNSVVSLKSDCINVRVGPGEEYPIIYRYMKKGLPVKIVAEFGTWRKVKDKDGDEGWISSRFISNKQTIIIKKNTILYTKADSGSTKLAIVEAGVVAEIAEECGDFVKIKLNYKCGWVKKEDIWRGNS